MTKTGLLELRNGENSGIEFKRDTIDNRAMAKEIVAFTNLRGGRVLMVVYGITPQRMITGCRSARNQLLKDVMRDNGSYSDKRLNHGKDSLALIARCLWEITTCETKYE